MSIDSTYVHCPFSTFFNLRRCVVAAYPDLTYTERFSLRIAAIGWLAAAVAMVITATSDAAGSNARWLGLGVLAVSAIAVVTAGFSGRFRSLTRIP